MTDQQGQQPEITSPAERSEKTEQPSGLEEKEPVVVKTFAAVTVSHSGSQATSTGILNPFGVGFSYQTHTVSALAFSPTENRIAFSCHDNRLCVCEIDERADMYRYRHPGTVGALTWSPDGRYIATISDDEQIPHLYIRDIANAEKRSVYKLPGYGCSALHWSPDGQKIAIAGWDKIVRIWNPFSGEQLLSYSGHTSFISTLAWSPDGARIVSGGGDTSIHVWEVATGTLLTSYYGHFGWLRTLAWSPDGEYIASSADDLTMQVWHAGTRERLFTQKQWQERIITLKWSPDGKHIVFATADGSVREQEIGPEQEGRPAQHGFSLHAHVLMHEQALTATWKEDLSMFAFGGANRFVEVADLVNGQVFLCRGSNDLVELIGQAEIVPAAGTVSETITSTVTDDTTATTTTETIRQGPAGTRVSHSTTVRRRAIKVWGGQDERDSVTYHEHLGAVKGVVWSPDSTRIASASHDGTIRVWDALTRTTSFILRGHADPVVAVSWSPDGQRLASGSLDKTAKVWDLLTGQAIYTYTSHTGFVSSLTWSPDGKQVASGSADNEIHIWDASNGETQSILHIHNAAVTAVAWSPDGRYLASGGTDQLVQIQELASKKTMFTYRGHRGAVQAVAWSPDSTHIASGADWNTVASPEEGPGKEATLHIWSANGEGNAILCNDEPHHVPVYALAWSPDGTMVAAVTPLSPVNIYDAATGEKAAQIMHRGREGKQHGRHISLAWSPDGTRIAAGLNTGTVKIWRAS